MKMQNIDENFDLYATTGDLPDEIDLQWDSVPQAKNYILQINKRGCIESGWKYIDIVSCSHYTVSGLKSNITYRFRVAAMLKKGKSRWSTKAIKKINKNNSI
jgi:hypothetical protein